MRSAPLFQPVTKFSAFAESAADFPRLFRQAWREAITGAPGPAHIDLNGLQAEVIEAGTTNEAPIADPTLGTRLPNFQANVPRTAVIGAKISW